MSFGREIGDLVVMGRIGAEVLSFEWQIRDVLSLTSGSSDIIYRSPMIGMGAECWVLTVQPNLYRVVQNPASGRVCLGTLRKDGGPPKTFSYSVGIRGSDGLEKRREVEMERVYGYYWPNFCSRSELMERRTRLLIDGVLNITCIIKRHSSAGDASTRTDSHLKAEGCRQMCEDFSKLLASGENSDVTIQVGDIEFAVHSVILLARSPSLSTSLRHECREKATNRIVIEDCDPEAFREFLHFLYAGSVQLLTEQNVFGLYRVADKYLADNLKQQCLELIGDTLSVQTFCNTIKLALTHGEGILFQKATDFAAKNFQSILMTAEWQNFSCENPGQANEVLTNCLLKNFK